MNIGLVLKAAPIGLHELIEAMAILPEGTVVERITRDNNESCLAMGYSASSYEQDPVVEIRLRLPKTMITR